MGIESHKGCAEVGRVERGREREKEKRRYLIHMVKLAKTECIYL